MRSLLCVAFLLVSSPGCVLVGQPQPLLVQLLPVGENTLEASDGEGIYTVSLEAARLRFTAVRVIPTTVLVGEVTLDTPIVDITLPGGQPLASMPDPNGEPLDKVEVELRDDTSDLALIMTFTVKLKNGAKVKGDVVLPVGAGEIQIFPSAPINLGGGNNFGIDIVFDKSHLLDGIDFDALAGCFDDTPAKSAPAAPVCHDFVIDADNNPELLPVLEGNLAAAFIDVTPAI